MIPGFEDLRRLVISASRMARIGAGTGVELVGVRPAIKSALARMEDREAMVNRFLNMDFCEELRKEQIREAA